MKHLTDLGVLVLGLILVWRILTVEFGGEHFAIGGFYSWPMVEDWVSMLVNYKTKRKLAPLGALGSLKQLTSSAL